MTAVHLNILMSVSNQLLSDKRDRNDIHSDDYEVNQNIADETFYDNWLPYGFLLLEIGGSSINMERG